MLWIFCTDPVIPDYPAKITDQKIVAIGQPIYGKSFALTVEVTGTEPSISWKKNGTLISGATKDTLAFEVLDSTDAGVYQCFAENLKGSDSTIPDTVVVLFPPTITTPDKKIITSPAKPTLNNPFVMYINTKGSDPKTYQWYRDLKPLTNATDSAHTITSVSLTDTGTYFTIVTNSYGADTCTLYALRIDTTNNAPQWKSDTIKASALAGSTYSLSLLEQCADADGDAIIFSLEPGDPVNDEILNGYIYTYAIPQGTSGEAFIRIKASDTKAETYGVIHLTISSVNNPPHFLDSFPKPSYRIQIGDTLSFVYKTKDDDLDPVTVFCDTTGTTLPRKNSISLKDSVVTWQSTTGDDGLYKLKLAATDTKDTTDFYIDIAIGNINLPPTITIPNINPNDQVTVEEAKTLTFTVSATDPDPGDTAYLLAAANLPPGATYDTTTGLFSYTPDYAVSTQDTNKLFSNVTFFAEDSVSKTKSSFVMHIFVKNSNRPPSFVPNKPEPSYQVDAGKAVTMIVKATDPDQDALTMTIVKDSTTLPRKDSINFADSVLTWQSKTTDTGLYSLMLQVTDQISTIFTKVSVAVGNVNTPPTITIDPYTQNQTVPIKEGAILSFTVKATDPDVGQTVTLLGGQHLPTGSTYDTVTGAFSFTPDFSLSNKIKDSLFSNVTFAATDNVQRAVSTFKLNILVKDSNRAPVYVTEKPKPSYPVDEGGLLEILFAATDADVGDQVSFSWSSADLPHKADVIFDTVAGKLSWQSKVGDEGNYTITFTATDGDASVPKDVAVAVGNVNQPPVVADIPNQSTPEGGTFTVISLDDWVTDGDNPVAQIKWTATGATNLTVTINETNRSATITVPNADWSGAETVVFTATDPTSLSDTNHAVFTVKPVNDAPSFTNAGNLSCNEDASLQTATGWATSISSGPANEASQTVLFTTTNDNEALFQAPIAVSPTTGDLTYIPAANASGVANVRVVLRDNGGTADGGIDSSVATITITVNAINDAPSFTNAGDQTALEDAPAQSVNNWATNLSAGPANESSQTLSFTATSSVPSLFSTQPAISNTGTLTYTPATNANGTAIITVTCKDNGGVANGGIDSVRATFNITITAVNDAPSFTKGTNQSVDENSGAKTVSNWATNLSKGPSNESSQALSFSVTKTNASLFSAGPAVSPTGTLTFTPAANQYGTSTVTVRAKDDGGVANGGRDSSDAQTFTITVNMVNEKPVLTMGSTPSTVSLGNVATYNPTFSDPDGNIDSIFLYIDSDIIASKKVSGLTTTSLQWTPQYSSRLVKGYSVKIIVKDTEGASDTGITSISVIGNLLSDSLAVVAILEANGETADKVSTFTQRSGSRITKLLSGYYPNMITYTTIPADIFNLTGVTSLEFTSSTFSTLPAEINNLGSLTDLYIYQGVGTFMLPPEIGDLTGLTTLSVTYKDMTTLPDEIRYLTNLNTLELQYNNLTDLPDHIDEIGTVTLDLTKNNLPTPPQVPPEPWFQWATDNDGDWADYQDPPKKE